MQYQRKTVKTTPDGTIIKTDTKFSLGLPGLVLIKNLSYLSSRYNGLFYLLANLLVFTH